MRYEIPEYRVENLTKKINRLIRKGADIIFQMVSEEPIMVKDNNGSYHRCFEYEISGEYKINGWEFVATLEHTSNGNLIRKIRDDIKIPNEYRTCPAKCDHCNSNRGRARKDTYIVYNEDTLEFKQVGSSCLKEYTGLDAEICAMYASILKEAESASFEDEEWDEEMKALANAGVIDSFTYFNSSYIKWLANKIISESGYTKGKMSDIIYKKLDNKDTNNKIDSKLDNEIKKYLDTLDTENDFNYNMQTIWNMEYVQSKHFALIAVAIYSYTTYKVNSEGTEYAGEIGDKIELQVKNCRVLYRKDNRGYSYYAEDTKVYEIIDNNGLTYIWDTPQTVESGDVIKATIKQLKEFRGKKQTVITRGKILNK